MKTHRTPLAFFIVLFAWLSTPALAQQDPPGRVGRLAAVQGQVYGFDSVAGDWSPAEPNLPLTDGDRISTGPVGRAELQVGSTTLRLHSRTELEVVRLDDERMLFQLKTGSLALRVRSGQVAGEIEIVTPEARLRPLRAGHYRIDRTDDRTHASSWRGELRVDDEFGFDIATGEQAELWRDRTELRHAWGNPADDVFAERVLREDGREETRTASEQFVSPEMTGVAELDRHGRWDRHPDYGPVWYPLQVSVGWAPYKHGRWAWVRPWGWTWVDSAPWGFAPFHYGRWVQWNNRWGWVPGAYVARPVFSPGLVHWSGTVRIGGRHGPGAGWAPLSPRERYVPGYRHTPRHAERIDGPAFGRGDRPPLAGRPDWRADGGRRDGTRIDGVRIDGIRIDGPRPELRDERRDWRMDRREDRRDDRQDGRRDERRDDRGDRRDERRDDRGDGRRDMQPGRNPGEAAPPAAAIAPMGPPRPVTMAPAPAARPAPAPAAPPPPAPPPQRAEAPQAPERPQQQPMGPGRGGWRGNAEP